MAKGNAIAAAVLASSGNPGTGGSGPAVAGGLSPLVASYSQQYSVNRPYSPLPRPVATFLEGAFGPFTPTPAMPIDPPREDTGRPDDRRFQYPVGWNMIQEPGTEGFRLTPYPVMRSLANSYSVARSCVDKRKQEILGLLKNADVVPTAEAEHAMMGDDKLRADFEKRRATVLQFFSHPDSDRSKYPTLKAWLSAILEDRFVIDAVAVHLVPPRRRGSGPFGSDVASLDILDGAMIRPMLNTLGATPKPPSVGFQSYQWGVPRADMMSVITEADLEEMDEPTAMYRADQLIYMRAEPRANTPYGFSCIEKALLPINIGLARQQFQSDYFAEGSVPAMFVVPGPDISTPQQIRQLQDAMNAMAGDIGAKHRIIVLPAGSKADPQKPVPLADQFDEWIISQVAMPFDLTPMDLGVTPRVSAVQSPSESRELSQINSDKGSQTRIEPVAEDLKAVLFDFVIQGVFGQKDMEWSFGMSDRGKNRQAIIDQGVQLVQVGTKSIDEFRTDLGDTPWGLPETSVPLWGTQMGPVPLSSVAAAPGTQPALPAGQQQPAAPSQEDVQRAKQVTDEDLTTPAHEAAGKLPDTPGDPEGAAAEAAAQKAELEILARYLRKGRDLSRFTANALPPEAIAAAAKALPSGPAAAVKAAQDAADAKRRQERRDRALEAAAAVVAAKLGNLVNGHKAGRISTAQLVDAAVMVMAAAYLTAILAGTRDASGDYDDTPPVEDGAQSAANEEALGQQGYLAGFLQDVIGGLSAGKISQRLGLYAATLWRVYNRSYGNTVMTAHPDYVIVWELGDNTDHCSPCVERDGKEFTLETLPGWPGDGGFGGASSGAAGALGQENICDGGPLCKCSCMFVQNGQALATGRNTQLPGASSYYQQQLATITAAREQSQAARDAFTSSLPQPAGLRAMTRDQLRQAVASLTNERIQASGGYSGVSVEPQDIPATIIAQMLPPGLEGAAGSSMPQIDVAQAVEQMFAAKASLATLDMTKAEFAEILKSTLAGIACTAAALTGPKADPRTVYDQLVENYRPRGIQWVLSCRWIGPVDIPADMVDTSSEDSWAASEPGPNTRHVERFEERIEAGDDVNPAVLVRAPGGGKLKDVDGHHRYRAYSRLGKPVKAYVGFPDDDDWRETHSFQVHSGGDPMNKQAGDEDPTRVAFLLMRAPNEAGKWRYLLQKRDDESWGLPGGKSHVGEAPWAAAVREAGEEMGDLPAGVKGSAVWTRAEDDHVVFTFLVDLPAMFTPTADGATSDETAGWGWFRKRDVAGLNLHPAMRETWGELDFAKPRLGGHSPDAVKAAAGYDLHPRSGMISLDVPDGLIESVPGGVTDSHCTLVYLGPDVDDQAFAEACQRAANAAAAMHGPLTGVISGRGLFEPSDSSDGKTVVWAGVAVPGVDQLHDMLADLSASEFTTYRAHVTRAYIDTGDELPDPVPPTPVTFARVSVHRGDDVAGFTLGGSDQPGEPHDGDRSTCPCGTPVIYDWANGWQHADGSVSHDDGESVSDKMTARG